MAGIFSKLSPLAMVIVASITAVFLIGIVVSAYVRGKYSQILKDLNKNMDGEYRSPVLKRIVREYRESCQGNYTDSNTQAIIEKNFNIEHRSLYLGERFVKSAVSLMIILGLLGTFYGLTVSIRELIDMLNDANAVEALSGVDGIIGGLIKSVKGMSVAFTTSLFGIAFSIVMTIINILFSVEESRETVMIEIEEYLDNKVSLEYKKEKDNDYEALKETLKSVFGEFGANLEENFKKVMADSTESLSHAAHTLESTSNKVSIGAEKFSRATDRFIENTRDFSEFNHDLRTNIQRMNVSFDDFSHSMKETTDKLKKVNQPSHTRNISGRE